MGEPFFAGASRAQRYTEPLPDSPPSGPILTPGQRNPAEAQRASRSPEDPYAVLAPAPPAGPPPTADTAAGWANGPAPSDRPATRRRGLFARRATRPDAALLEAARSTILSASWTRSVNVLVTNPKGGAGKTPTALLLAGILGSIRSGYVAVWEASEGAGTLLRRSEGVPRAGISELAANVERVRGVGQLGGYMAAQSSHVDVLGSTTGRLPLSAPDVLALRRLLDLHYKITITDTGNQLTHASYGMALRTADAAVLPCRINLDDLAGVESALAVLQTPAYGAPAGLAGRSVVLLTHDGGPESPEVEAHVRARLSDLNVSICEVPYDPAIREGGVLSPNRLSAASQHAWTVMTAQVVACLLSAPDLDLVHDLSTALTDRHIAQPTNEGQST